MESSPVVEEVREKIAAGALEEIAGRAYLLRNAARDMVARVLMSVRSAAIDENGRIDWKKVDPPSSVDAPLTHEEVARFLGSSPPEAATARFFQLFDPEDDGWQVTPDDMYKIVLETAPAQMKAWAESQRRPSARFAAALRAYAEPIGAAMGAVPSASQSLLDDLPAAGQARYLARAAEGTEAPSAHELRSLASGSKLAPDAYTTLVERVIKDLNPREADRFQIDPDHLDAAQLGRLLTAARTKEKVFQRLVTLYAIWGTEACATALAGVLGDPKRGARCARWLAALGAEGRKAVRDALASPAKKAKEADLAKEQGEKILALPETAQFLPALIAKSATWSLDLKTFLIKDAPAAKTEVIHPAISLDAVTRALSGEPVAQADLPPHHWADLLQITAIHPQIRDIPWAYDRASKKGLLGRGADPGNLIEAIDRFSFDFYVKDNYKSSVGLLSMLLGAGAPREIILHAMAVFASVPGNRTLGQVGRHFELPLERFKPPQHEALLVLARHLQLITIHGSAAEEMSRWPLIHRAEDLPLASPWTSPAPLLNFRMRARVTGASKITVKLRNRVTLTVDVEAARWTQTGLSGKKTEGPTALPSDPAVIELEVYRNAMRFGAFGTHVGNSPDGYLFEGVGQDEGPVEISAEGEGARLVEVILTENRSMRDAGDIADLLGDEDVKAVKNVAGTGSEFGALALAAEISLGEVEDTRAAAQKALIKMGGRAAPFIAALGLGAAAAAPKKKPKASVRSFEDVLTEFAGLQKKKKKLQRATLDGNIIAASFGTPASPKWRSGYAVSEDTIYLIPPDHYRASGALDSGKDLIDAFSGLPTVTTWNTRGEGETTGKKGVFWIVSTTELQQEQDEDFDTMSLTAAAWKVQEGIALAIFREGGEELGSLMGLPDGWPKRQDWESISVWIGE